MNQLQYARGAAFDEECSDARAPLRVVHVAFRDKFTGTIYWVAQPARHHDVIRLMVAGGIPAPLTAEHYEQGFRLNNGSFVGRVTARVIASAAGQLLPRHSSGPWLFSEDLW